MIYKSNAANVIGKVKNKLSSGEILIGTIAQNILASNLRRIHNEGRDTNGKSIGSYSIKPLYVNPKNSPKQFAPIGKTGKKAFHDGKPHKTAYFQKGYKGFRERIGRKTSVVNLQLTGSLLANFQLQKSPTGYQIGFLSAKKGRIAEGLEKKYRSQIWGLSQQDRNKTREIIKNWLKSA